MKELKEKRAGLIGQMKDLNDKLTAEKRGFTAEERVAWDKMADDLSTLESDIERLQRADDILKSRASSLETMTVTGKMSKDEARAKVNKTFQQILLAQGLGIGQMPDVRCMNDESINPFPEYRTNAQSTTDGKGGYLIPEGFSNQLEVAKLAWGGMLAVARIINTASGNDIPWPATNDTGNVAYQVDEAANLETSAADVTFTKPITLKAWKWSSGLVRVSREIIEDSYFNMETLLADLFGLRMGRGLNAAYTTGVGTTTISGVVTGATDASVSSVSASAITYNNLLDLMAAVDPAYHPNARFMFNAATLTYIRKIIDGNSRPLWEPNIQVGAPQSILGYPYTINQDVASIGASAKSVLFGDFSNYIIRKVAGDRLVVLRERFADTDQIGMVLLTRTDGQVLDAGTHPIKYMAHGST